jgi:hypothetical protein
VHLLDRCARVRADADDGAFCARYLKAADAFGLQLVKATDITNARGPWLIAAEVGLVSTDVTA